MIYHSLYKTLKESFDTASSVSCIHDLSIKIRKRNFISRKPDIIKDESIVSAGEKNSEPDANLLTGVTDSKISSNNVFEYYTIENTGSSRSKDIIFLFHGLNEKRWDKYFPWAYELTRQTGKTVVLFPLAFHMNRAPYMWSDFRLMNIIAARRSKMQGNAETSCINAAISERLELSPQRFFLSGLRTYYDFCSLIKSIRKGNEQGIAPDAKIDLFGYSIGAFFSLLLLMDNPDKELSDSRLMLFCGGATFDGTLPVSRYIIDLRALQSVENHFNALLNHKAVLERKLKQYFSGFSLEKSYFGTLINLKHFKELREIRLNEIHNRISAIALTQDEVIPPGSVSGTLRGGNGNIASNVSIMDFEYPYNHVTPFPLADKFKDKVDRSFSLIMESASAFLL